MCADFTNFFLVKVRIPICKVRLNKRRHIFSVKNISWKQLAVPNVGIATVLALPQCVEKYYTRSHIDLSGKCWLFRKNRDRVLDSVINASISHNIWGKMVRKRRFLQYPQHNVEIQKMCTWSTSRNFSSKLWYDVISIPCTCFQNTNNSTNS